MSRGESRPPAWARGQAPAHFPQSRQWKILYSRINSPSPAGSAKTAGAIFGSGLFRAGPGSPRANPLSSRTRRSGSWAEQENIRNLSGPRPRRRTSPAIRPAASPAWAGPVPWRHSPSRQVATTTPAAPFSRAERISPGSIRPPQGTLTTRSPSGRAGPAFSASR